MGQGLFVGDGDEIDFIEDVEHAFGIGFSDGHCASWHTIGDVHATLLQRLDSALTDDGRCSSQMTFYRLRQSAGTPCEKVTPRCKLEDLQLGTPRATFQKLGRCGLRMPLLNGGWLGGLALLGIAAALLGLIMAAIQGNASLGWLSGAGLALSMLIGFLSPARYPSGIVTLGDLAHDVARRNSMVLRAQGARLSADGLWSALRSIAADCSGIAYEKIDMDTPLIATSRGKRAA